MGSNPNQTLPAIEFRLVLAGQQNLSSRRLRGRASRVFDVRLLSGFRQPTNYFTCVCLLDFQTAHKPMSYVAPAQRDTRWYGGIAVVATAGFCFGWALSMTTTTPSLQTFAPSTVGMRVTRAPVAVSSGASRSGLRNGGLTHTVAAGPEESMYFEQPQSEVCGRQSARIGVAMDICDQQIRWEDRTLHSVHDWAHTHDWTN